MAGICESETSQDAPCAFCFNSKGPRRIQCPMTSEFDEDVIQPGSLVPLGAHQSDFSERERSPSSRLLALKWFYLSWRPHTAADSEPWKRRLYSPAERRSSSDISLGYTPILEGVQE